MARMGPAWITLILDRADQLALAMTLLVGAGLLANVCVETGASRASASAQLIGLLDHLFVSGRVCGRGEARAAAGRLLEKWRPELVAVSADEHLAEILPALTKAVQEAKG